MPDATLPAAKADVLAGMLIRRVVPAIVTTLAVYAGLAFAAGGFLREHYLTPLLTSNFYNNLPGNAWITGLWWTKGGRFAFGDYPPASLVSQFCPPTPAGKGGPSEGWGPCLVQHGYTQWTSYQPTSRFWPFQWIEGGWLLALSALLIAVTIGLVHRRAA